MKGGSRTNKTAIVLVVMVLTVLALFYYMSNKEKPQKETEEATAVQNVLLKNLDIDYPSTPREVLKFYNEVMSCFYNEEYTEEELTLLAVQAERMYDEELKTNQSDVQYMANLKAEIDKYKKDDIRVSGASVASATDVDYFDYDGRECARIRCGYTLRQGTKLQSIKEIYVLRRDDAGHWKILGWDADDGEEVADGQ